jgi:hypothetical protein
VHSNTCETAHSIYVCSVCVYLSHLSKQHPAEGHDASMRSTRTKTSKEKAAAEAAARNGNGSGIRAAFAKAQAMSAEQRAKHDRRYMLMCVSDLRPFSMNDGEGFELFVGGFSPSYAVQHTHHQTIAGLMDQEYITVRDSVIATLKELYISAAGEPFCSHEIDMTTTANTSYCTLSVNYISAEWVYERVSLCTREFPLDHKAVQVAAWVKQVTHEYFGSFMPENYQLADIFVAGTVDQGSNVFNAVKDSGVTAITCAGHRLNSAVHWMLGISGTIDKQKTCKNPELREVLSAVAAMVGHFSHSTASNDVLHMIQAHLWGGDQYTVNLIRRNDTRWGSQHAMLDRALLSEDPIRRYYTKNKEAAKKTQLSEQQWGVVREVASVLDTVREVNTRIQGGRDMFIGQCTHLMQELLAVVSSDELELRDPDVYGADETVTTAVFELDGITQKAVEILVEQLQLRELGIATNEVERMAIILDPRFKDKKLFDADRVELARSNLVAAYQKLGGMGEEPNPVQLSSSSSSNYQPPTKKQKLSVLEKRQRAEEAKHAADEMAKAAPAAVKCEVTAYLDAPLITDFRNKFDLLEYWKDKASDQYDSNTEPPILVKRAEFPLLARLAKKYLSVDATSCEAERVFSCLALTLDQLRCSLAPSKVEKMMFLRLNKRWIPEFKDLHAKKAARAAQQASNATDVANVHANIAEAAAVAAVTPTVAASLLPAATAAAAAATRTTTAPVATVVVGMTN